MALSLKGSMVITLKTNEKVPQWWHEKQFKRFHSDGTKNSWKDSTMMALKTVEKVPQW